tara:strand:+ start:2163 stop:2552 length:390 start_codon:yes stop_codon:yes gene_type:complete
MADSRRKGANFELQVCRLIKQNLNIEARRNLDQYQASGMADIIIPNWSIECKAYQKGTTYKSKWWRQTKAAALTTNLTPVLIYKFNNSPIKCVIQIKTLTKNFGSDPDLLCEVSIDTWFYIVRERDVIS